MWLAEQAEDDFSPQLDALQSISLTTSGSWTTGRACALRAIAEFGGRWWSDPAGRFAWNTAARGVALSEQWDDDERVVRDATIAMSRDPRRGSPWRVFEPSGTRSRGARSTHCASPPGSGRRRTRCRSCRWSWRSPRRSPASRSATANEQRRNCRRSPTIRPSRGSTRRSQRCSPLPASPSTNMTSTPHPASSPALKRWWRTARGGPDLVDWVRRTATAVAIVGGGIDEARRNAMSIADPFWGPVSQAAPAPRARRSDGRRFRSGARPAAERPARGGAWPALAHRDGSPRSCAGTRDVRRRARLRPPHRADHGLGWPRADGRDRARGVASARRVHASLAAGDGPAGTARTAPRHASSRTI